jgi:hypothetical protein
MTVLFAAMMINKVSNGFELPQGQQLIHDDFIAMDDSHSSRDRMRATTRRSMRCALVRNVMRITLER